MSQVPHTQTGLGRQAERDALLRKVLADADWTREVVVAAMRALIVLEGPETTVDGDDHRLSARTALRTAFVDTTMLVEGNRR